MKRLIVIFSLIATLLVPALTIAGQAYAVDVSSTCGVGSSAGVPGVCNDLKKGQASATNPIVDVIKIVIEVLAFVIGIASIIGIIVSGIRFAIANGDSNAIATARNSLIYSLVGIAVAVLAQTIVFVVLSGIK